ncbi:ornithine carbamoyltransferase [uncultured Jatrophihabitans sp.]|uniref:ornithine carbamoyltransferase n=1 Tax=uncultured Jatrophihabitans sp. TaxID=1610747 RepID=UPI0035CAF91D
MPRHFLRDDDLAPDELLAVLDLADEMKADRHRYRPLAGPQAVALIFDKPTLRTQLSFSVGISELGGQPVVVDGRLAGIGQRESIADVTRVVSRQVAAIVWRTFGQDSIEEMAALSPVPVINALTDQFHPCQILADLQTVREHKGHLAGLSFAYVGDAANNMAHSYLLGAAAAGLDVRLAGPPEYQPDPRIVADAERIAAGTGASITVTDVVEKALDGADVVVTDTWVSMGQEAEKDAREAPFLPYAVTADSLEHAASDAIVLHCLPAYRGKEISAEVLDGPRSVVWDEAENRLHAQKALLAFLLERSV